MKGNNIGKKFMIGLCKTSAYLLAFAVISVTSYHITLEYYKEEYVVEIEQPSQRSGEIKSATLDDIATNAIFAVNEEDAKITSIVLEIFNCDTKNIDFVTIPAETLITMDQEVYEIVYEKNPNIPQIIALSDLGQYVEQEEVYEYATLLLEYIVGNNISFYTKMSSVEFNEYFEQVPSQSSEVVWYQMRESKIKEIDTLATEEEAEEYLEEYYTKIQSNMTLEKRKTYITYYLNGNYKYIYHHLLAGEYENGVYYLNIEEAQLQLQEIEENQVIYREEQSFEEEISAIAFQIQILNASRVTGIAAAYQARLEAEGYTIVGIGDYEGEIQEQTRILVPAKGIANELLTYFTGAIIQVDETLGEDEIQIHIGKMDA